MMSAVGWVARHALVLLVAVSLAGCLEDDKDEEQQPTEQPTNEPPPAPPPTNSAPEITGTPAPAVEAGQALFIHADARPTPTTTSSSSRSTNMPTWAAFNAETGALTGTPGDANVGDSADITITRDRRPRHALGRPVQDQASSPRNQTPPPSEFAADDFRRAGQRGDGQPGLQLPAERERSEQRRHAALRDFQSSVVGELQHLDRPPDAARRRRRNIGTYSNIVISVNDGRASAALPAFSIQVREFRTIAADDQRRAAGSVQARQAYSFTPSASAIRTATR